MIYWSGTPVLINLIRRVHAHTHILWDSGQDSNRTAGFPVFCAKTETDSRVLCQIGFYWETNISILGSANIPKQKNGAPKDPDKSLDFIS